MRKLFLAAAAALVAATPAFADDWDFILTNSTGKPIKKVEVAPTGTTDWQANKVDPEMKREATLADGKRMTVHFNKGAGCKYDIKATFGDDSSSVWTGVNVCDSSFVTVKLNAAGTATFTAN